MELSKVETSGITAVHAASIGGVSDISVDQDLERAIEESKKPAAYEEDLKRAILLSQRGSQRSNSEIVDLTG